MMPRQQKAVIWMLLAGPAAWMLLALRQGWALPMDLLRFSGEMALRLMILAMLAGPLADFFGPNRLLRGWMTLRRNLGVAAFGYGSLHLLFYVIDMGSFFPILAELSLPAIWTGWAGFALTLAMASISHDLARRKLGRWWKPIQRAAYPALFLVLVHWMLLDREWASALIHLAPLLTVWTLRGLSIRFTSRMREVVRS